MNLEKVTAILTFFGQDVLIDQTMAAEGVLTGDVPEEIKKNQGLFCSSRISFPICFTVFFFRYFFRSRV
jgi:hypothetical protein